MGDYPRGIQVPFALAVAYTYFPYKLAPTYIDTPQHPTLHVTYDTPRDM